MTRRSTHVDHPVVYATVGASAAPDLLRFPPDDSTPFYEEVRLGSGPSRFLIASSTLMTWGAHRTAGFQITNIEASDEEQYAGIIFNEAGVPEVPATPDVQYGPDGEPYLTAGTTATVLSESDEQPRSIRIVYTEDSPRKNGFAWGSADNNGVIGEACFSVEHREDDTVWGTVQGFYWAPEAGILGLKGRAAVKAAIQRAVDVIEALLPGASSDEDLNPPAMQQANELKLESSIEPELKAD